MPAKENESHKMFQLHTKEAGDPCEKVKPPNSKVLFVYFGDRGSKERFVSGKVAHGVLQSQTLGPAILLERVKSV